MLKGFDLVVNVGCHYGTTHMQRRNIKLSNFLALLMAFMLSSAIFYSGVAGDFLGFRAFLCITLEPLMLLSVIALNKTGYITLSRIFICWLPSIFLIVDVAILMSCADVMEASHFVGFRIFQFSLACFPFLVFNTTDKKNLLFALAIPLALSLFCDVVLSQICNNYDQLVLINLSGKNIVPALVSFGMLSSALIFLKRLVEHDEKISMILISESDRKITVMEQNAAESERKLNQVYARLSHHISHSPLPIIKRDRNLRVTFWNKRAEELFGLRTQEVLGNDYMLLIHPDHQARFLETLEMAISGNENPGLMETKCIGKNGETLNCIWYHSFIRDEDGQVETVLSFVADVTEQRALTHSLTERIKELRTLYNVSQLLTGSDKKMEDVFESLPDLLPAGWQFPEICEARLVVFSKVYQTRNFRETPFKQSVDINIRTTTVGSLEVLYLECGPWSSEGEGPFLKEERDLLIALASMLREYILGKLEEDELTKSQANLFATINNTETMVWSVDQNLKLLTFNESFSRYNLKHRNMPVTRGIKHHYFFDDEESRIWEERYLRALGGETVKVEEKVNGNDFRYSLNPIVEKGTITGVSVFADDVTEQNSRNSQLAEANRKIIDLKMMALRSVMNPHFIFNVLSSIQYFITRNDELNAINYLTSFSKLMRTVLTRSVADLVTVSEEIALVRNYVDLEKLRFEDKFYFDIECKQPDRLESIKMPSLLLQPYVENAILHGLYNKEGKGTLIIRIKELDEFLIFEIEDDGIGRDAARKITDRRPAQRKSMGTQLTEERLALLNGAGQNAVTYTDLYKGKKPAGTRVTIHIKIKQSDDAEFHNN